MVNFLRCSAVFSCIVIPLAPAASADLPVGFCDVLEVTPSRTIRHEIDLKGQFDKEVTEAYLTGPQRFSHAVGLGEKRPAKKETYLNWYKIEKPRAEPRRALSVRDPLRGNAQQQIVIEHAAFLLSPSQSVTSGPPSRIPDGLNPFKAYRIVDSIPARWQVKLTGSFGTPDRVATRPVLFCVPVQQWHHDEHFPIKNPAACMLVYEQIPSEIDLKVTTLDQFGLNSLTVSSAKWICLPSEILTGDRANEEVDTPGGNRQ
jgi:hypothetical protein